MRKNKLGESFHDAKILNDTDRLNKFKELKEKEKEKESKKRKERPLPVLDSSVSYSQSLEEQLLNREGLKMIKITK